MATAVGSEYIEATIANATAATVHTGDTVTRAVATGDTGEAFESTGPTVRVPSVRVRGSSTLE